MYWIIPPWDSTNGLKSFLQCILLPENKSKKLSRYFLIDSSGQNIKCKESILKAISICFQVEKRASIKKSVRNSPKLPYHENWMKQVTVGLGWKLILAPFREFIYKVYKHCTKWILYKQLDFRFITKFSY